MEEWKEYKLEDLCDELSDGLHKAPKFEENGEYIFVNAKNLSNGKIIDIDKSKHSSYAEYLKYKIDLNDRTLLYSIDGTIGNLAKYNNEKCILGKGACYLIIKDSVSRDFIYYQLQSPHFKNYIKFYTTGSTIGHISLKTMRNYSFLVPPLPTQQKIAAILSSLDDKIELNNKINENLEQQAQALFKSWFIDNSDKTKTIGDYITPKRGKNLLSKDAIIGDVPVVAGGLEPATYHNVANTKEPVITISASGANAGFVKLWNIPVWSSDSSFIDSEMTKDIYFWYVLLKMRQKEIFDSQTGSAQPHIYPQHIAVLPITELDMKKVSKFTELVTPLFQQIGNNQQENIKLSTIRDTLLPKLMNGEK